VVVDRRLVERRLLELDTILGELQRQEGSDIDPTALESDLSRPWRRERGLLSAANLVLDIASHVTAGHFAVHPATYEETLRELANRDVLEERTYGRLRGLGGFRNVLAHEYLDVDLAEVVRWRARLLDAIPSVIAQVEAWLDRMES